VFFGRMFSPITRNVQFCSDLFGVSLYNSKVDNKQAPMLFDRVSVYLFNVITKLLSSVIMLSWHRSGA